MSNLPPGCTQRHIDEAFGCDEPHHWCEFCKAWISESDWNDEGICLNCGSQPLPKPKVVAPVVSDDELFDASNDELPF